METIGMKAVVRSFVAQVLDEPNGVNANAYEDLKVILTETGNEDVIPFVKVSKDRMFLLEDWNKPNE